VMPARINRTPAAINSPLTTVIMHVEAEKTERETDTPHARSHY
jgi:hypothetical protein